MKYNILLLLLFSILTFQAFSQNYYEEYPISVSIASNGSQKRLQCSVYDSVQQTTVSYNSDWITTANIFISGNAAGKICYTLWDVFPTYQLPKVGFIIFNSLSHEFIHKIVNVPFSTGETINAICGKVWIEVIRQKPDNSYYINIRTYYRYNTLLQKWVSYDGLYDWSQTPDIWTLSSIGNTDRLLDSDDHHLIYYDPISDVFQDRVDDVLGGINYYKEWEDCYIAVNNNYSYVEFYNYDPSLHQLANSPRKNLIGDEARGIFFGYDVDSTFQKFFFLYDLSIQQWVTDSVYSTNLINIKIKDRVIAYTDITSGFSQKVFYMVYNPVSHSWIKDSTTIAGVISGLQIQNGTVMWNDNNGAHVRGYNFNSGWGNYNTTLFLNFHLTDFGAQGINMIHVRNYSIGSDSLFFDFGDGVVSSDKRNVLWHTYNEPGIFNVCLHDSSGVVNVCQSVTVNPFSMSGYINFSSDTICLGDSVMLSLQNYTGSIQWQSLSDTTWIDETGPGSNSTTFIISPLQTTIYRVKVTNGTANSAYSNEQQVYVHQPFSNVYLSDTLITKCQNISAIVQVLNAGLLTNYYWQTNNGSGWIYYGGGTGNTISPSNVNNGIYRVIISKGNCYVDTLGIFSLNNLPVPSQPTVVVGPPVCGPGYVTLLASGTSTMLWSLNNIDSLCFIGNPYSPYIAVTTSYKVLASDGNLVSSGYADNSIGALGNTMNQQKGIRFYTTAPAYLEYFYVYASQPGNAIFRLYHAASKQLIKAVIAPVTANPNGNKIWFRTALLGNVSYDLIVDSISDPLNINTSGITYPVTNAGSPIVISGYVDSSFHTTPDYYNFYNINVTQGCRSTQNNVTAQAYTGVNATINYSTPLSFCQGGSVNLQGIPNPLQSYSWLRNGLSIGVYTINYIASTPGLYQVIIANTNCSDTSASVSVTVPCIHVFDPGERVIAENETDYVSQINMYYDASSECANFNIVAPEDKDYIFQLIDPTGRELLKSHVFLRAGENKYKVDVGNLSQGLYLFSIQTDKNRIVKRFVKN